MSSCCSEAAEKTLTADSTSVAQLGERPAGVLLRQRAQPVLAEELAVGAHRLGHAVRVEHEHVAGAERQRAFLQQPLEQAAIVDVQAQHHAVGRQDVGLARQPHAGPAGGSAGSARRAHR